MKTKPCSICSGPSQRRVDVDAGLAHGHPVRDIATRAGVSQSTISRHKANCQPSRSGELIPAQPEEVDSLRKRLRTLERLTDSVLHQAASERDSKLLLDAVKRATSLLEVRARLQGELEDKLRAVDLDLRTEAAWNELVRAAVRATAGCSTCRARLADELRPGKGKRRQRRTAPLFRAGSAGPKPEPEP